MGKGNAADRLAHERALAGVLFQELHPGGGVVEQVPHGDGGAHRARARLHAQFLAALDAVAAGELVRLSAGEHLHPCHAGDGGQRFAPESQRVDALQVLLAGDFAGGVADEGGDIVSASMPIACR